MSNLALGIVLAKQFFRQYYASHFTTSHREACAIASVLCLPQVNKHDMDQGGRDQDFFTRTRQDTRLGGKPNKPQPEVEQRPGRECISVIESEMNYDFSGRRARICDSNSSTWSNRLVCSLD